MNEYLTYKQIIEAIPSVGATQPSSRVSDKYTFIPTTQVLEDFDKHGWKVVKAIQTNTKDVFRQSTTKHMLNLRHPDMSISSDLFPEIVLTNSHDGLNSFMLHAGLFRLICENGLVIADKTFQKLKINHIHYTMDEVTKMIDNFSKQIPQISEKVDMWSQIELEKSDIFEFGWKAGVIRFGEEKMEEQIDVWDILSHRRSEDNCNTLWCTYNRVQENLMKGGIDIQPITEKGKLTKSRKIVAVDTSIKLNKDLWSLTEAFADDFV